MAIIRKRKTQANYLEIDGKYEVLGVGFTELNESPSAQTTSKRYINQASATQSVTGYEWSTSFNTDMIKNEVAVEHIRAIGELQKIGADTEANYVIVDLDEQKDGGYRARQIKIAIAVDSFDDNDGELAITGSFLGVSDIVEGVFDIEAKTFTANE